MNDSFNELKERWPQPGDVLRPLTGTGSIVVHNPERGTLWTTAVVDTDATGWFLDLQSYGVKCMIADISWDEVLGRIEKANGYWPPATVRGLLVVRLSNSKKCLICELSEGE